jgi:site-specific DNA recombinase
VTRAAVYLRISQDPTGQAAGVTRQREDCLSLVGSQDWELFDTYIDNDISASKGKVRPAYKRLLADIKAGHVDAVVAWHPDRLYRKLTDLEGLIAAIESRNVIMRTVRAGEIDLSTPTGRMLARILSATAQAEGEVKADRWARSWRQGREQGAPARTGTRLFGYTRDGRVIPEEAATTRRIVADLLAGKTLGRVTSSLDGTLTTRGTVWRNGTVKQYLLNPRIAGFSTLKGEVVAEGTWEPLVGRDDWETLRGILTARTRDTPPRVALLGGLIYCGRCGHRLITGAARKGRTYRCPSRPGMPGCGRVSSYAGPIEEVVEGYAQARLADPRVLKRVAELRSSGGTPALLSEVAALEARLLELERSLEEPGVPVAAITRAMSRARDRLAACQVELAEASASAPAAEYVGGAEWPDDLARRRQLVAIALGDERVYLDPVTDVTNRFDPRRLRIVVPD